MNRLTLTVSAMAMAVAASAATAGEQIQVAGSSTVLPFATIAAEAFGDNGFEMLAEAGCPGVIESMHLRYAGDDTRPVS